MKHALFSLFLVFPSFVFAHAPEGAGGGFITGFLHPILGFDHLIAMVAVGLWGAFLGDRENGFCPSFFHQSWLSVPRLASSVLRSRWSSLSLHCQGWFLER